MKKSQVRELEPVDTEPAELTLRATFRCPNSNYTVTVGPEDYQFLSITNGLVSDFNIRLVVNCVCGGQHLLSSDASEAA
jgi:hypothetical protein